MSEQTVIERETNKLYETLIQKLLAFDVVMEHNLEESEIKILLMYLNNVFNNNEDTKVELWGFVHNLIAEEEI